MDEKFGVVLVAGLTVFGLIFIYDEATDGITVEEEDEMVLYEKDFGTVGSEEHDHRTISLGDFNVGHGRGDVLAFERSRSSISDRLGPFRGQKLYFDYNATQPQDGKLEFEVLGREGSGAVYLKVNGEKVFDEHLVSTSNPEIEIDEEHLRHGVNEFELGVNRDGIFSGSEYVLEDVELRVSDRTFSDHRDNFRVYSFEIEDFVESELTFDIQEAVREEPLEITVNDDEIYNREQARTTGEEAEIPLESLNAGSNTIEFSTSRPAEYHIENADITVRSVEAVQREEINEEFELSGEQLNFADRQDTQEIISFDYRSLLPTNRNLNITLNEETHSIEPETGFNQHNVSEDVLQEDNELEIKSNGAYVLEDFRITSSRGE